MTTLKQKQDAAEQMYSVNGNIGFKRGFVSGAEWQEHQDAKAIQCLRELHEYYGCAGAELLTEQETELWDRVARIVDNQKKEGE
ncbi:hypothetical protein [Chitinophaga varians]|uniref:hypothetical protein n=1 Tax=Chitinophaga varians TaxID=2202339 RepID=UPI00165FD930|nr:hypothetical protein [Chitinophaga varians]MBC9913135.1 hypothetical protein [Chitinophaga varians]